QQLELVRAWLAFRHHVGVLKHRDGTLVRAVHDGLVGPLEVESVVERLAHARIGELLTSRVDEPALGARRRIVRDGVALDPAVLYGREIVARRPGARGELLAEQIILRGKALDRK